MRRWGVLAWLVALLIGLVGCGRQSDGAPTVDGLDFVAAAAEQAGPVRFTFRMNMSTGGTDVTMVGDGLSDAATGNATMALRGEGVAGDMIGENQLLVFDGFMYLQGPMAQLSAPTAQVGPNQWVRIQAPAVTGSTQSVPSDYGQLLDALRATGSVVEELGASEVNEVAVDGYRTKTTIGQLMEQQGQRPEDLIEAMIVTQPEETRAQTRELMAGIMPRMLESPVTFEVWIDADDLPRRLSMSTDMTGMLDGVPGARNGTDLTTTMQYDLLEYGVEFVIEAPPSEQVVVVS